MKQTVILIGPMGAGKSSIGRQLAKKLHLPFTDTDQAIRDRTGVDIGFIFEKEGEAGFRERESAVLRELLTGTPAVVATGGGIVVREQNRELLRSSGTVIFLETSVKWQLQRARRNQQRPLMQNDDPESVLADLYRQRLPFYRECASFVVNTDGCGVEEVVRSILHRLPDDTGTQSE